MTKEQFREELRNLNNVNQLTFYSEGKKVTSRFDLEENDSFKEEIEENKFSYPLFSLIENAVLFKGSGKIKEGKEQFNEFFKNISSNLEENARAEKQEKINDALSTVNLFISGEEKVELKELVSKLTPLVLLNSSTQEINYFNKNKEKIYNLTFLEIRSLFHTFLINKDIDPSLIKTSNNLFSGLFIYDTALLIPTILNAYTIAGFKQVVNDSINNYDFPFDFSLLKAILVLYTTKDILVEYTF